MKTWTKAILLFAISGSLQAAAPLTHLMIGEDFLSHHKLNREQILLGTVFPDIRYLGGISREETHEAGLTLDDVMHKASPFKVGMGLHSVVDEIREELVLAWGIYEGLENLGGSHVATLLKLLEDEMLYDESKCFEYASLFNLVSLEELAFGLPEKQVREWHGFLMKYLSQRPSATLAELASAGKPLFRVPAETVAIWSQVLPELAKDEKYVQYIGALLQHFSELFEKGL